MKKVHLVWFIGLIWLAAGCNPFGKMAMLDMDIPQIETPIDQIATIRKKTIDGRLIQTALVDRQGRVLEEYNFGRTNSRVLNQYDGSLKTYSITHFHLDDNPTGINDVTEHTYIYDRQKRLQKENVVGRKWERTISYLYTTNGDTIKSEQSETDRDRFTLANVDQWTRNDKQQIVRHYRLYVTQGPKDKVPDTVYHWSERYAYSADGKRVLAWYDYMYLGRFYSRAGADTTRYQYDSLGRLTSELKQYTTDMRNKQEIDVSKLDSNSQRVVDLIGSMYFTSEKELAKGKRITRVRYQYELFNPTRHLPLYVPPLD